MGTIMKDVFQRRPTEASDEARRQVHHDAQSLSFYADISMRVRSVLPTGKHSLLDIGPRTGSGLALLRIHHPLSYSRVTFDPVTGVDPDPAFKDIATELYPDIEAIHGNGFEIEGMWDVVMSSHTIEHVHDPVAFLQKLTSLARRYVIVACPFEENDLISEHCNRITYPMLTSAGFWDVYTYQSNHWFNSLCCIAIKKIG
jgi:SAM-dependent methyltransferase